MSQGRSDFGNFSQLPKSVSVCVRSGLRQVLHRSRAKDVTGSEVGQCLREVGSRRSSSSHARKDHGQKKFFGSHALPSLEVSGRTPTPVSFVAGLRRRSRRGGDLTRPSPVTSTKKVFSGPTHVTVTSHQKVFFPESPLTRRPSPPKSFFSESS